MNKITLLDTTTPVDYQDYLDYCDTMDIEPQGEYSPGFIDYANMEEEVRMDDFWRTISNDGKYTPVTITGTLGLWDGKHEIEPVYTSLMDAVSKCFGSGNDATVTYNQDTHTLEILSYHHDGCNRFEIQGDGRPLKIAI